jgi:hypothetical protein
MWGTYYRCFTCLNYDLCFKCYGWKNILHHGHDFEELEAEGVPDPYTKVLPRGGRSTEFPGGVTDSEDEDRVEADGFEEEECLEDDEYESDDEEED